MARTADSLTEGDVIGAQEFWFWATAVLLTPVWIVVLYSLKDH